MLTVSEIISQRKKTRERPDERSLRSLPYKEAYIYGRVSSPQQLRNSKESIREIAALVQLALNDGYRTGLTPEAVEAWLLSISEGTAAKGVLHDGEVTVDVRDLALSGQLSSEERAGMADLQRLIKLGRVGAVYLTEGVSRLSCDEDHILPYQLLKLLKQFQVRVRTPDRVLNPVILRDWQELEAEFEDAIDELKVMSKRLQRRKAQKAARGEYVGGPVAAGLILPIAGRKPDGRYEYGKEEPYPPHAAVVQRILEEFVRQDGKKLRTIRALGPLTFPFFPPELSYMERLTSLRMCPKGPSGYRVTTKLVEGLATNVRIIGVWQWGDTEPIMDHHQPVVPRELFLSACELATKPGKPKGRAADFEPMEWAG